MNSKVKEDFIKIVEKNFSVEGARVAGILADMCLFNDAKVASGVLHDFVDKMVSDRYTKAEAFCAASDMYGYNYENVKSYIYRYPAFEFKK